ncbi:MAG: hypothetical protein AAGF11_04725 [Myxococcota bacterium]
MSTCRRVLLAASLAAPLALASCGKKKNTEPTQPPVTPAPPVAVDDAPDRVTEPEPAAERLVLTGSLQGLEDIMVAFKKFGDSYMPDDAFDPKAELQANLLGMGFGPGFLTNIDLDGLHAFSMATPADGGRAEDTSLSASMAVFDARKLIDNMPQSQRPSPLGEGMWELAVDTVRVLMREQGKELLVGFSVDDVDSAGKLRGEASSSSRIRLKATNIPVDDIDPAAVLEDLPSDSKLVQDLAEVLRQLEAVTFEIDAGTTRDFYTTVGAIAPFSKLGLGPIGTPRTSATALESRLPADPVFAATLSWGDPALLHTMLGSLPIADVPDPVKGMVEKAVASAHSLLDQIATDVVIALYLDKKGQATIVLAADVKDEAKAKAALQGVHEVLNEGIETQATMAGKNKDGAFSAKLELNGMKVAGGKADRLTVKIPKGFQADVRMAQMFLRKNSLEAISHVDQGTAIMAIGAGARGLVTDVAKNLGKSRSKSLATNAGLEGVRKAMGGCQICVAGDPLSYFRVRLMLARDQSDDKAVAKEAGRQIYALSKVDSFGWPGAGIKVEPDQAAMGMVIPQTSLFAPRASVEKVQAVSEFINDPQAAQAAAKPKAGGNKSSKKK